MQLSFHLFLYFRLQRLLRQQNVRGNIHHQQLLELEDQFDVLMDANDQILERAVNDKFFFIY